jgi:predicted flap endonuclease-1-like 5' DNA nuclease
MAWLLIEILAFVVAGVIFGGLVGLGLAALAAKRRAAAISERERQGVSDQLLAAERGRQAAEARAAARGAAEAAARGDLEARLVEMEAAAADYRARAEAAERRLLLAQPAEGAPELTAEPLPPPAGEGAAAETTRGDAEATLAMQAREIASLSAQLALAERVRARSESDLAVAQARAEEALRAATGLGRGADDERDPASPGERPPGLPGPRDGRADDLRRIRGIGPRNEGVLNSLGIYHYEQIAALTPAQAAWLDHHLKLFGRIARDDWIGQAGALLGAGSGPGDKVHPQDVGA